MKATQFRVLGEELGVPDSYLDLDIDGIDSDGTIYFQDTQSEDEYDMTMDRVRSLMGDGMMVETPTDTSHKLWERLDKLSKDMNEGRVTNNFAKEEVRAAQRALFRAVYEETR